MTDYSDDDDMEGMTYHDRLEFWGVEVPPNKVVNIEFGETDEELIHLTQVALGDKPGDEPAAVSLVVKGQSTFIGTLRKVKCDQFSLDLALGESFGLKHTGKSTVYVTGWRQVLTSVSDEDEESDEGEEEEEEEEQEAPRAAQPAPKKAPARDMKPLASAGRPEKQGLHSAAPAKAVAAKPAPAAAKKAPPPAEDSDEDDESDDDDSDDSDDDDDKSPPKVALGKRPAEHQLMSPPAAKKTPMAMPSHGKTPATTPLGSKTPITPAAEKGVSTPGSVAEFEAQIVSFLKTHGRTGMSALGGKVKKPGNVQKLNAFIKERPHIFTLIGDQVELAKKK